MRHSKQREAILEVLKDTNVHPDAEWVHLAVKKSIKNISLGTVYRNLKELCAAGMILSLSTDGQMRFDGNLAGHAHFVCKDCGKILDIKTDSGLKSLLEGSGHQVESESLIFYGKCSGCLTKV